MKTKLAPRVLALASGIRSSFENVSVTRCTLKGNSGGPGISLSIGTVSDCDVTGNTGGAGIQVTAHSLVLRNRSERNGVLSTDPQAGVRVNATYENCGASGNIGSGFYNDNGQSNFRGCHAANNSFTGIQTIAFIPGEDGSSLVNCTVDDNGNAGIATGDRCTVTACTASGNGGNAGIVTGIRALVSNCSAHLNTGDGIFVGGASSVVSCNATGNGTGSGGAAVGDGIHSYGSGSRFDGNLVRDNHKYGIEASDGDVIVGNRAGNNGTANFQPATGTNVAPVQSPNAATPSPFANVVF